MQITFTQMTAYYSTKFLHGSSSGHKIKWRYRLWCFNLCTDDQPRSKIDAG